VKQQCGSVVLKRVVMLQLLIFVGRFSPFLQGINEMFPSPAQDRPCSVHVVGTELLMMIWSRYRDLVERSIPC
jgi:hypothetical protein